MRTGILLTAKNLGLNSAPRSSNASLSTRFVTGEGKLSQKVLIEMSKHKEKLKEGPCHLEGQAVRAADKISYLISDIEDGIRLQALSRSDILSCRFFHRPPLDFTE